MTTESLNKIPANEWYETLAVLQGAGVTSAGLKKIRSEESVAAAVAELLGPSMELSAQLERWQQIFDEADITCDTPKVKIPEHQPGIDRLIINPQGLMPNRTITCMRERFKVWTYTDDLDKAITKNDRSNEDDAYAIWVRDNVEADEEYKSMSANDIAKQEIAGQTLMERLLHEWMYFDETGKHLDIKNVTLCTGSRDAGGSVPGVCWYPGSRKVDVDWYLPGHSGSHIRARAAVS